MAIKNGGPAFPVVYEMSPWWDDSDNRINGDWPDRLVADTQGGMTLRDYFAGQVITCAGNLSTDEFIKAWARVAYAVADAMLQAREEAK
jgi:hypothetical protein